MPSDASRAFRAALLATVALAALAGPAYGQGASGAHVPPAAPRLNTSNRVIPLTVPMMAGPTNLGEVNLAIQPDDSVRVETRSLLAALAVLVDPAPLANIVTQLDGQPLVGLDALSAQGITLSFDSVALALVADIPAGIRSRRSFSLSGAERTTTGTYNEPAGFSAYLNMRGALSYVSKGFDTGLTEPTVILDGAVRFGGVVLEGEGGYFGNSGANGNGGFIREGTRIVYDDLRRVARYTAGDLFPIGRGFQSVPPVAGLSIVRSYSELQPLRNIRPGGSRSFTLARPSIVETFVNDISVRRERLDAGVYDLRDFPLAPGSNNVRVVVQDDTGLTESFDFSLFFDRTLLRVGTAEFSAHAGIRARESVGSRAYLDDEWLGSAYYRRGLTDNFTAGGNFQIDRRVRQVGAEAVLATGFGIVGMDAAFSHIQGFGGGYALNIGYQAFLARGIGRTQSINATFERRSRNFAGIGIVLPYNPYQFEASVGYSRAVGISGTFSIDARYAKGRDAEPTAYLTRAVYSQRISYRLSLSVEARYEHSRVERGPGGRLALTYRFGDRSSARAEIDSRSERARLQYQQYGGQGVGAYNLNGQLEFGNEAAGFSGDLRYNANRAELGLAHNTSFDRDRNAISDQRSSLRAATSIAFADGSVAIGRPIYDSFAIVERHPSLDGAIVEVRPIRESYQARADGLGAALVPNLSSYIDQTITYIAPDAPQGYDLGEGSVHVLPPYRSGYRVVVGSDYSVTVVGRLLGPDGQPVVLLAGQATEIGSGGRSLQLFTNRDGRFGLSGARAGRWRIEMNTVPASTYILEIDEAGGTLIRAGDLRPDGATAR